MAGGTAGQVGLQWSEAITSQAKQDRLWGALRRGL